MANNHPEALLKIIMKNESNLTPEEIDEEARAIVNDPRRMELVPTMIKLASAVPAYPEGFEAMKVEMPNY